MPAEDALAKVREASQKAADAQSEAQKAVQQLSNEMSALADKVRDGSASDQEKADYREMQVAISEARTAERHAQIAAGNRSAGVGVVAEANGEGGEG